MKLLRYQGFAVVPLFATAIVVASARARQENNLPSNQTAIEAVRKVFDLAAVRRLERSTFEPIRPCFSAKLNRQINAYLAMSDRLQAKRDDIARQGGITESRWWPPDIDIDLHLVLKNDPLTNRASVPDEISIADPRVVKDKLQIVATEHYTDKALDGSDLGGTKTCEITLVPERDRWAIDEIKFTTHQYERVKTTTLTRILQQDTNRLRKIEKRMVGIKPMVRRAVPATPDTPPAMKR